MQTRNERNNPNARAAAGLAFSLSRIARDHTFSIAEQLLTDTRHAWNNCHRMAKIAAKPERDTAAFYVRVRRSFTRTTR